MPSVRLHLVQSPTSGEHEHIIMSTIETMVKVSYTVGRFQPPTIGHRMLIKAVREAADPGHAYVFVSAVGPDNDKNPLPAELKLPLLQHMFPDVKFIHTKRDCLPEFPNCGGPGMALAWLTSVKKYDPSNITVVLGKERLGDPNSKEYFGESARIWGGEDKPKPAFFVPVGHVLKRDMKAPSTDENNMSGTKARSYVTEDDSGKRDFYIAVGYDPKTMSPEVEAVYNRIYEAKFGVRRGGNKEEEGAIPTGGPDGEPQTARRYKTRRLKKSKASSRALYRRGLRSRTGSSRTNRF